MDKGVWWATVHGVTRVRHDSANKPTYQNYVEVPFPSLGMNHMP